MQELEGYFKALADANRLRIINLLFYGELCGCDIQVVLETSQPNASRHLTYLKHAGLVRDRREGFRVFYGLIEPAPERLRGLFDYLRTAFKDDPVLRDDLAHLKQAIKDGACTFQQIRPLPRLAATP
jgi:ArsR family transcriptional regulator